MNLKKIIPGLLLAALVLWIAWGFWDAYRPVPLILQGQVEAQEFSIASKVPGRIAAVNVRRGDRVQKGQLVFSINSPELQAKLEQARGSQQAAGAVEQAAEKGAREQEKNAAFDQWQTARAAEELAAKTYERLQNLFDEGVVAEQRRDEAFAAYQAAQYAASAAFEIFSLADEGARGETIDAAMGQSRAATGLLAEAEALEKDLVVESPFDGEVSNVFLHAGELAPQGFPVVMVVDVDQSWAVFQVREDLLDRLPPGQEISVQIPALGDELHKFVVSHISVMGDFATWRSTNASSGYDLRTFEVEAHPGQVIDGLRVGMTVLLTLD